MLVAASRLVDYHAWGGAKNHGIAEALLPDPTLKPTNAQPSLGVPIGDFEERDVVMMRDNYERLKKRLEASAGSPAPVSCSGERATFVELAGPVVPVSGECLLELEDSSGAKLRVHFKGVEPPDLVALSRSFWGMRS